MSHKRTHNRVVQNCSKKLKDGLYQRLNPAAATIIGLTLLRDTNSLASATSCLGVLTTDTETPVVSQPTVVPEGKAKFTCKLIQFKTHKRTNSI